MSDFLGMGGYGGYVWSAYALFFLTLLVDSVAPILQRRRLVTELRGRMKREAARRNKAGGTP